MQKRPESHPRNDETFRRACQLTAEGISGSKIAETLDISSDTLRRWTESEEWAELVAEFQENGTRNQPRDPQAFDQACKLQAAGMRKRQIADAINISIGTVTRWSKLEIWESKVNAYKKHTPKNETFQPRNRVAFENACQLKAANVSLVEIAATVRVSVATIRRWSRWEIWNTKVKEYEQNQPKPMQRSADEQADEQTVTSLTRRFLDPLKLREIKEFCIALKRNLDITEKREAEEQELADAEIIQKLEEFCKGKNATAIQLRNQWVDRMRKNEKNV